MGADAFAKGCFGMKLKEILQKKWYPYAAAGCITVTLYVILLHIGGIWKGIGTFLGYFKVVILGSVLAYMMNPLAKLYQHALFRRIRRKGLGWSLSIALAVITVLLFLTYFIGTVVPQLIDSITTLVNNLDNYVAALRTQAENWSISSYIDLEGFFESYEDVISVIMNYLSDNLKNILSISMAAGRSLINWMLALILSVYLLAAKDRLVKGLKRFLYACVPEHRQKKVGEFLTRCNAILGRYVAFSVLESVIIGVANAVFMNLLGMQYTGLISIVVAVFNLIPTFGPFIGGIIGGFILLLVNPLHALIFLIFTLILQTIDGYVIKPKLFGASLGVSGLLILIGVLVGGKMLGIVGVLLAIPLVAILDTLYSRYFLPALERRRRLQDEHDTAI